jgi:predicted DNA-binding WGR domain protein
MYVLFTCWGRIGDSGQFQQTPFPDEASAVKEFGKIFRAKTGNEWKNLKS